MFDFQSRLIFPTHAVADAGPLPPRAEQLALETSDGKRLAGVYFPGDRKAEARPLILGFGGNAWNAQDVAAYLHELYPDNDVIAFHYRGYAPSTGAPSSDALIADAPLIYDFAVKHVAAKKVITIGFSIGSGVAAQLAAQRRLKGLILVTPFDSLKAVAQSMYPWLPISAFFNQEIDAAAAIARTKVPVAVIAAERDEIVPGERTNGLRARVPNLEYDRTIARAGHNDLYARSEFQDAMREALRRLEA